MIGSDVRARDPQRRDLLVLLNGAALILCLNLFLNYFPAETLLTGLSAGLYLASLIVVGFAIQRRCARNDGDGLADWVATGVIAATASVYLLAALKLLQSWAIALLLIWPIWSVWQVLRRPEWTAELAGTVRMYWARPGAEYVPFILPLAYSLLPIVFYDSLVYGVGVSNLIHQNGGFISAPFNMYYNLTIYYELALIPAVAMGEQVPRVFHFFLGGVYLLTVADYASSQFGLRRKWRLLLILVCLPVNAFLMTTVKADLITSFFLFLAVRAYLEKRPCWSGILIGFAVGIKLTSALAPIILISLAILRERRLDLGPHLRMTLCAILVLLPLVAKNWHFTGNPVFPVFSDHFSMQGWDADRYRIVRAEMGTGIRDGIGLLRAPYDYSFKLYGAGGFTGPLLLIALPFLLLSRQGTINYFWLWFALLYLTSGAFFGEAVRYFNLSVSVLAIYAALAWENVKSRFASAVFTAVLIVTALYALAMLEGVHGLRETFFNNRTFESYLRMHFPSIRVVRQYNGLATAGDRLLVVGDPRGYYVAGPYMIGSPYNYSVLKPYLASEISPSEFRSALRKDGYTYLLVDTEELARLRGYEQLSDDEWDRLGRLVMLLSPVLRDQSVLLFRL